MRKRTVKYTWNRLLRTMTTGGILILTFTPLMGVTDIVRDFLEEQNERFRQVRSASDLGRCSASYAEAKAELLLSIPPYQREAQVERCSATWQLAQSIRYPRVDIVVADFAIPDYFPRAFGLDVGWNKTAAVFGAHGTTKAESSTYLQ